MRALRFEWVFILAAAVALGGCTAGQAGLAREPAQADRLTGALDRQLDILLAAMIASAGIGPDGEIFYHSPLGEPRFLEPGSGRYWQVSADGQGDFPSRSLADRRLATSGRKAWTAPLHYDSGQLADEPLRIAERTVRLPGSQVEWQFVVAGARDALE